MNKSVACQPNKPHSQALLQTWTSASYAEPTNGPITSHFVIFDEIIMPWQVLKIAKSKLQPDDPLLMGLGQG